MTPALLPPAGDLPNVYLYAANNPSESIIAKRRGYGTVVSYNVPPYGRAGLYKQLAELKALLAGAALRPCFCSGGAGGPLLRNEHLRLQWLMHCSLGQLLESTLSRACTATCPCAEYREQPETNEALKAPILELLASSGLHEDCPFDEAAAAAGERRLLAAEDADAIDTPAFTQYASRVYQYLQVSRCCDGAGWGGAPRAARGAHLAACSASRARQQVRIAAC
jgi:magnesium chelatase subunit H